MLHKSIKFFIENKAIAALLFLLFLVWGTINAPFDWNLKQFPRNPVAVDAIPNLGENQQIVYTKWEGQSPQDIEDQITYPLSSYLLGIPGVKTIRSSSMFGFSSIYIIFKDDVEFYWSRTRILEKLNALPNGLLPKTTKPTLGPDATALGQVFWYTLEGRDAKGNTTGGWDLHELRSIQDYTVKFALSSANGVAEVASIGGHIQEYQIDVDPELMRQYNINLQQVVKAVKQSNKDIGAQTLEINQVEYFVRGLGSIKSIADIENAVVSSNNFTSITLKDIANISIGPKERRGILDKEGAEVVGGVVTARYGENPLQVIQNTKEKIKEISKGLPSKKLANGSTSQLTIVPFYDRTALIKETIHTLEEALTLEILITILVIIIMVYNIKASLLISGLLPVAVFMVFISMKFFNVEANIVALSGIAIAIGTMVDIGIILSENIIRHLEKAKDENQKTASINQIVYNATTEVSGAIVTAICTTIISFLPVFTLLGAEGKLFKPLAFTKTMALIAALIVALFLIPPFAAFLFKNRTLRKTAKRILNTLLVLIGGFAIFQGFYIGITLLLFGVIASIKQENYITKKQQTFLNICIIILSILILLTNYWQPLGVDKNTFINFIFVIVICFGILGFFLFFRKKYTTILKWALDHKMAFLSIPIVLLIFGFWVLKNTQKEFMPSLNEGSFLLMPTSMAHAGVSENKRVLQQLDMAVASIPEIETVVGKAGRTSSSLDPAPLSMYENLIQYKSEYLLNAKGVQQRYQVNADNLFVLKNGDLVKNPNNKSTSKAGTIDFSSIKQTQLIEDDKGALYRNWRPEIKSSDDIWKEIVNATQLPGVTSAPKLQPIETRLVMLQTGMRAPMGIKVKGQNLAQIEAFSLQLEEVLKEVHGIKKEAVFADRIVGKPYALIDIDRTKIARYGLSIQEIQNTLKIAIGGAEITQTIEGRERYGVRVRYPRALRANPSDLEKIYIAIKNGKTIPLSELANIRYEKGPQVIKSEDGFLVGYVLFDKLDGFSAVTVVENAQKTIQEKIQQGKIKISKGVNYQFTGTYENQIRAEKTLSLVVPLALFLIFLVLYFQFKSIGTSLIIFSGITVAFAGGFILIWLYGQDWFLNFSVFDTNLRTLFQMHPIHLSVAVWVGFIALFGIATDDGVIMASYLKQTFQKNKPDTKALIKLTVIEAGEKRIRPCLMTTATTLLALLPILTATGRGSDIMIPMAIPSFGGMLIALITLFVVPVLFSWKQELKVKNEKLKMKN